MTTRLTRAQLKWIENLRDDPYTTLKSMTAKKIIERLQTYGLIKGSGYDVSQQMWMVDTLDGRSISLSAGAELKQFATRDTSVVGQVDKLLGSSRTSDAPDPIEERDRVRYEDVRIQRTIAPENVIEPGPVDSSIETSTTTVENPQSALVKLSNFDGKSIANPLPEPEVAAGPDTTTASTDVTMEDLDTGALVTTDLRPNPGALMPAPRPMEQSGALVVATQPGAVAQITNPYTNVTSVPIGTWNQDVRLLQNVEVNMQNNQYNQQNNQYNQFVDATTNNLVQYFQQNNFVLDDQRLSQLQQGISYIGQQNYNNQARTEAIEQLKLRFQEALVTGQTDAITSSITNASVQQSMQNAAIVDNINATARALSGDLGTVYRGFMEGLSNLSAEQMAGNERQLALMNEMLIQLRANQPPPPPPNQPPNATADAPEEDPIKSQYDWNTMSDLVSKFQQGGDNQEIKALLAQMLGVLKLQNRKEIQQQLFQENAPRPKSTVASSSQGIPRPKNFTRLVLYQPSVITQIGWDSKILPKK